MFKKTTLVISISTLLVIGTTSSLPVYGNDLLKDADLKSRTPDVSPIRRIERSPTSSSESKSKLQRFQTFNGSHNNLIDKQMGAAGEPLIRRVKADYADGISELAGSQRMSARAVSNSVNQQNIDRPNSQNASDYLWQWGQFLDHDIDLTDGANPVELADIIIPSGDTWFDPGNTGSQILQFNRSLYDLNSGTGVHNPRQQTNEISAWIDASNVYGSDEERANALRTLDGSGRLKTSDGNLLPFNSDGLSNAGGNSATLFLAGDVRANEQVGLTAMHTLFMREHNRLADLLKTKYPELDGDQIYYKARRLVAAEMQIITYHEYLPILLGRNSLPPYSGYRPNINGSINNLFSTGLYRYGHSALSPQLLRLNASGDEIEQGHLALRNAFFAPFRISEEGGIEPILRGLAAQRCQQVDVFVIDEVRNFLFGEPGSGGFDLAALNIQRGRDHGLPDYNSVRIELGMQPAKNWSDISSDAVIRQRLANVYTSVNDVDVWIGGLAEDHVEGAMIGKLIYTVLKHQFINLRDGDRFWYQHNLNEDELAMVKGTRLSDVIRRNTQIGSEIPSNVFRIPSSVLNQIQHTDIERLRKR